MVRKKHVGDDSLWNTMAGLHSVDAAGLPPTAEDVASQIQGFIISQNFSAGARLPSERDLAVILSTSRPTLRQAIRILVVKGLVEARRGSGTYVSRRPQESMAASVNLMLDLDPESVQHLNDLRLWLETMGIVQAIDRCTQDEIREAEQALERLKDCAGSVSAWMSADTHFHSAIVRAAHNPYLASIFESVHTTLIEYEYKSWMAEGTVPRWLRKTEAAAVTAIHQPILAALKAQDEEAARIAVLHHHYVMAQHLRASHSV